MDMEQRKLKLAVCLVTTASRLPLHEDIIIGKHFKKCELRNFMYTKFDEWVEFGFINDVQFHL